MSQDEQRLAVCVPQSAGLMDGGDFLREGTRAVVFSSQQIKLGGTSQTSYGHLKNQFIVRSR